MPRVHGIFPKKVWSARYDQINDFERMLAGERRGACSSSCCTSRATSRRSDFEERIADETKNWKFRVGDLDDRERWDDFTKAYRSILEKTSTDWAPWYLVPADDKDVRNYLIARLHRGRARVVRPQVSAGRSQAGRRGDSMKRAIRCALAARGDRVYPHAPRAACRVGTAHVRRDAGAAQPRALRAADPRLRDRRPRVDACAGWHRVRRQLVDPAAGRRSPPISRGCPS